jgi:hypothetical protein
MRFMARECCACAIAEAEITSTVNGVDAAPVTGNCDVRSSVPDIPRPICAIWHAEELLKTNNPADLKGRNSSEICPAEATLRSNSNPTLDEATELR